MRVERLLLTVAVILSIASGWASTASAQIQFFVPYLSNEQIELATQTAKDSIGNDALLVGIATSGVIDLGSFGTYDGFNIEDGKSTAWGYQYLTPSGDDGFVVGIVNLIVGGPQAALAERGNDFGLEPRALDLSGAYVNSDAFVAQLKKNNTFTEYLSDYPSAVPEGIVLSWEADGQDFLPDGFPVDKPLWGIYFNTNTDTPNDSTMVCFVASGTGQTECIRADVSGVKDDAASGSSVRLTVAPNPARESGTGTLHIRSQKSEGAIQEVGVYDMVGRKILDLTNALVPEGAESVKVEFSLENLTSGNYVCRVVQGGKVNSTQFVVE